MPLNSAKHKDYETVFYAGGHGPMWDLAEDPISIKLIESFPAAGVTLVCHGPGAPASCQNLRQKAARRGQERVWVHPRCGGGRRPNQSRAFLVEDELLRRRLPMVKSWGVYVVTDGLLIAGQNPGVWSEISD